MDKGLAWVSLIPTFGIYFTSGVLQFASGLIRKTMLQNTGNSGAHYITWISSIYSGSYNILGPLSSIMVYKMGCRKTVLIGGTLETLGLISSFFVKDNRLFLFTYSILSGMGAGISYPPVGVLLGYNFDRYLPLASGIAVSGVGIGFIVMPFLTHFLLIYYGLQGTFLVMAGLTLQKWVFGALMRPSPVELEQLKKFQKTGKVTQGEKPNNVEISNEPQDIQLPKTSTVDSHQEIPSDSSTYVPQDRKGNEKRDVVWIPFQIQTKERPQNNMVDICITAENVTGSHGKNDVQTVASYDDQENERMIRCRNNQNKTIDDCKTIDNGSLKSRPNEIKMADTLRQKNSSCTDNDSANSVMILKYNSMPLLQKDQKQSPEGVSRAQHGLGTKASLLPTQSTTTVPDDITRGRNPYIDVVKNSKFLLFLFCNFCFTVSEVLVYLVIPTYFMSKGSTESEISYLLTILGICSTVTRPLMGFLANSGIAEITILFSAPFGILGIITFILPLMAHKFVGRICFIIAFGLYQCSVYSLLNKMLIKICGLDNLSAAFGFMMMAKGIASIFGPPITVALANSTDSVFFFAGFMYEVCTLAALFLNSENSTPETEPRNLQLGE